MKGLLADYLIKTKYGMDPDVVRILHKCVVIIEENNIMLNPIQNLLDATNNILKLQVSVPNTDYHKNSRRLQVVDEIHIRLKNAIKFGNKEQILLFLNGELSLYNLGKTSVDGNLIHFDSCISCDGPLTFDKLTKKYNCNICLCEYQG